MQPTLLCMPIDVMQHICSNVHFIDRVHVASSCRLLRATLKHLFETLKVNAEDFCKARYPAALASATSLSITGQVALRDKDAASLVGIFPRSLTALKKLDLSSMQALPPCMDSILGR